VRTQTEFKFLTVVKNKYGISAMVIFIPVLLAGWLYDVNFVTSLFFACAGLAMLLAIGMMGFLLKLLASAITPTLDSVAEGAEAALILFTRKILVILAIISLISAFAFTLYSIWIGAISPTLVWLEYGKWPERDLLYFLGSSDCGDSYWRSSWQTLKDWCRPESVNVTNWVGLDKLLNYLLDVNISLVGMPVSFIVIAKVMGFLEEVGALDQPEEYSTETENEIKNG
jgi:hypothetical protein